ncbi:N-acetylglucosamine-6-phosphate deacetylase [Sphingomonas sp.]|uniref:N-acetylglucosamine-6-phosphate deacetylase n=1 Tax=Sphingomonas sp. TaxID=28214 RepID=UPI0025D44984|nr:N-acetylglucosamine-6-phosphate deacetylase [Sphingomonas sp.]MBV9529041.1 N-acetylglucosamine-6-phosphate deacetylase [Sphingomonas sp.]
MVEALVNSRVLIDGRFVTEQSILLDKGCISAIVAERDCPSDAIRVDLRGQTLVSGFIDVQVNGGGDRLFNDDPSVETIAAIGEAHRRFGTTGFLPTLISDDEAKIDAAMNEARRAIAVGIPGVLGIHIEGPFLNPERKGIHDAAKLRRISEREIELLTRPTGGATVVTVAPETMPVEIIRRLTDAGVIVCAGHTQANGDEIAAALRVGLRGFTHLFNAMSPLTSREPGTVGAALLDEASWCGIIVDGHHVDPRVLTLALRAAPLRRFIIVSDAMPSVGGRKSFTLNGEEIAATGGKCVNAAGTLAGSDLDMASAVRNAVAMLGLDLADAVAMASTNPAAFLRLDGRLGRIAPGYRANLVLLDDDLAVTETWIDGVRSA